MSTATGPEIEDVEDVVLDALVGRVQRMAVQGLRFVTATCIDAGEQFEILYHFDRDMALVSLRVLVEKGTSVPTITSLYPCAFLIENEVQSLFGVVVEGLALDYRGRLLTVDDGTPPPLLESSGDDGMPAAEGA